MAPRIREPSQRVDGFSNLALTTFKQMLALERQCDCDDGKCIACREWWGRHRILMRELALPPWCYPAVERPGTPCPFPKGSAMAKTWQPDLEAQARWTRLEQAVRKTRRALRSKPRRTPEMATSPPEAGGQGTQS
jgi:hypothetical protein